MVFLWFSHGSARAPTFKDHAEPRQTRTRCVCQVESLHDTMECLAPSGPSISQVMDINIKLIIDDMISCHAISYDYHIYISLIIIDIYIYNIYIYSIISMAPKIINHGLFLRTS